MTNGGNHSGSISIAAEIDEWTFTANAGDHIALSIGEVLPGGTDPGFVPWIRLRRPDAIEIGSDVGLLAAQINVVAPLSGTYTVLVRDSTFNRPGTALGDYLLHFVIVPGTPIVPSGDHGGPLTNGDNHAGLIHVADLDVWTFAAAQNDAIIVTVGEVLNSQIDPDFRPFVRLFGPNGALLGSSAGLLGATLYVSAPLSGTYTVLVADYNANREGSAVGDYLLHLVKAPGTIVVPSGDEGGPMTIGRNHAGRIGAQGAQPTLHRNDLDAWTFAAAQNDAIIVTIGEVLDSEIDPDFRPYLRIFGPNGNLLGSDAGLLGATLYVSAPLTGTYTVVVADYNANREGSAVGDYLLHLVKAPGTLEVPTDDEGGPMTNGANHAGRIGAQGADPTLHRGDLDAWTFTAAQNDAIIVTVGEVLDSEIDPDFRPYLRIFGPNGNLLGSDAGLLGATLYVGAPLTGTYTVVVADYNANREGSAVGDYQLHLVKVPGALTIPTGDEGGALTNGANHAGRIGAPGAQPALHRGDVDAWTFTAAPSDSIMLTIGEVLDSEINPDFRPYLRLFGPNGTLLGSNAGLLSAAILDTISLSGTYTVVVTDYNANREGSAVGDYVLHFVKVPGALQIPTGDDGGQMINGANHPGRIGAAGAQPHLRRSDLDPWTFGALQNSPITLRIDEVLPAGPDPNFVPMIRLYGPTGVFIGSNTGLTSATIAVTAPLTGTYTVVVCDNFINREGSAVGDYVLTVSGASNLAPVAVDDAFTTLRDTTLTIPAPGVLGNDLATGGGTLTAMLVATSANGTLTFNTNGSFVFTPAVGFVGTTNFTYVAEGPFGQSNVATVAIIVSQPVPTSVNDAFATDAGSTLTIPAPGVLVNDDGMGAAMSATMATSASNGSLAFNANGSFTYTPNVGFAGTDSFTYRAVNSGGAGNIATVTITVNDTATPQPPTGLYASSIAGNLVTLRFTRPTTGPAAANFVLEGGVNPGEVLASLSMGTNPIYSFTAPTGSFYVRVHTMVGTQRSVASNEIRIFVNAPAAPSPPANFTTLVNGSFLALAWRNTFEGGAPTSILINVTGSVTSAISLPLSEAFTFTGVPGGTYTLTVRAVNATGTSAATAPVTLTFPGTCSGAPEPPSNPLAYRVGNVINVVWDPAASGPAPTAFVLNVTGSFVGTIPIAGRGLSGAVGPGTYHFTLVATNPCGSSAPTASMTVVVP
jgi:hypothetical protein